MTRKRSASDEDNSEHARAASGGETVAVPLELRPPGEAPTLMLRCTSPEAGERLTLTIGSGASENVISALLAPQYPATPSSGGQVAFRYTAANGTTMPARMSSSLGYHEVAPKVRR